MAINPKLIRDVKRRLELDPRIPHPTEVAVSGSYGIVTLQGTVGSLRQRRAAVEDAGAVQGVDEIVDELRIDLLESDRREADELRGMALQTLIWDADVPRGSVDVAVDGDRWVTLWGKVEHQYQSDAAYDDVSRLIGVLGVTNEIKVVTRDRHCR